MCWLYLDQESGSSRRGTGQTYLGTEAVSHGADLLEALLLQPIQAELHDRVNGLLGMGVLPVRASTQPLHEVEAGGHGHGDGVAVEDIHDNGVVTVGGELIGHELGVLPDTEDVGDVEECYAIVLVGALGFGDVGLVLADLDGATSRLASAEKRSGLSAGVYSRVIP